MRRRSNRLKTWLYVLVFLGILSFSLKTLYDAGALDKVWDHPLPGCKLRKGIRGIEDVALVPAQNRIIMSAWDRNRVSPPSQDGLYTYDPSQPDQPARQLHAGRYHGIAIWSEGGETRLFAILHAEDHDHVQIFGLSGEQIFLIKDISFPDVRTLNEVLPLGPDSFFVSQDLGMTQPLLQKIEAYLQLKLGKVWLFDGQKISLALEGLQFPDGLEISPDKKRVYLGSMSGRSLMSFHHKPATHQLNLEWTKALGTGPDNFSWTSDNRLLVASHLNLLQLDKHSQAPVQQRAPSQVLLLSGLPDQLSIEEIYSSEGSPLSAISSVIQWDKQLIMGSAFDDGFLVCDAKN